MLKKFLEKYWPILLITAIIFAFHYRLFFPLSIFVNPDFGRTDILHIELPQKYLLSTALKNFQFPLWETQAGQGYPTYTNPGNFLIPDLIILFLLPFNVAIPVIYLSAFLLCTFSMYFLLKKFKLGNLPATFGAISFTFSAALILRVQHLAVLEAIAFIPLFFYFYLNLIEKPNLKNFFFASVIASQIFVTFPQILIYGLSLFVPISIGIYWQKTKSLLGLTKILILFALYVSILSAITILPWYETIKYSNRAATINSQEILTKFPLYPKNLLSFLNPFINGKASNGTYNSTDWANKGVYWENTAYIGLIPLIFLLIGAIYLIYKRPKNLFVLLLFALVFSLLLALGRNSPLHVLYSIPPLNAFRIPSRYLIFAQFFAAILCAYSLNQLQKFIPKQKFQIIGSIILFVLIIDFYFYWWHYNPIGKTSEWIKTPEILDAVPKSDLENYRTYSVATGKTWNEVFTTKGWENQLDVYKFLLNATEPNSNLFLNINHFSSYQLLPTRRQALQQTLLFTNINNNQDNVEFEKSAQKLPDAFSIKYLITTQQLETNNHFKKLNEIKKENYTFFLYENLNVMPILNLFYDFKKVESIPDYTKLLEETDLKSTALIENPPDIKLSQGKGKILIMEKTKNYLKTKVDSNNPAILVYSDSIYPGWKAKIDGRPTKIYAANINSKSVFVDGGNHIVEFFYFPKLFYIGVTISLLGLVFPIFWFLAKKYKSKFIRVGN